MENDEYRMFAELQNEIEDFEFAKLCIQQGWTIEPVQICFNPDRPEAIEVVWILGGITS